MIRSLDGRQAMPLAFAVNLDPDECDPAAVTPAELKDRFGPHQLVVCENPENIAATIRTLRQGESLWELFLSAVLVALVVESFLANRLVPRAPQPVPVQPSRASRSADRQDEEVLAFLEQQANRM